MRRTVLPLALATGIALFSATGCSWFRTKPKPSPPPPPAAAPVTGPRTAEAVLPEPKLPEPPVPVPKPEPGLVPEAPKAAVAEAPKPKPEPKSARRGSRSKQAPGETKPPAAESAPASPAAPTPRLGEVLTANQRNELLGQLDGNVATARQILGALSGKVLTREQSESAARVRAFIEQALGLKDGDLGAAVELSRRALVLAQDLAGISP